VSIPALIRSDGAEACRIQRRQLAQHFLGMDNLFAPMKGE